MSRIHNGGGFAILPSQSLAPGASVTSEPFEPAPTFYLEIGAKPGASSLLTLVREGSVTGSVWSPLTEIPIAKPGVIQFNAKAPLERFMAECADEMVAELKLTVGAQALASSAQASDPGTAEKVLMPMAGRMNHVVASGAETKTIDLGEDCEGQWLFHADVDGYLLASHVVPGTLDETATDSASKVLPGPLVTGQWVSYWVLPGMRHLKWKATGAGDLYYYRG